MADPLYNAKVYEKQGGDEVIVASGGKITEEPGGAILGRQTINVYAADVGAAGSYFVEIPYAGSIVELSAVSYVANTTTKTVLGAKIATVAVTIPAWEIAVTQAAGVASTVVPTAANVVTAGAVLEITSDGGSATSNQATMFSVTILRTS